MKPVKVRAPDITDITDAIRSAVDFLYHSQTPSGEFKVFRSTSPTLEEDCVLDSSPFPTALIAYCLSFLASARAKEMRVRAVQFLRSEMEPGGVWRYWTSRHPYHKNIPPDLDDTACVSLVLRQNNAPFIDNRGILLANRNRQG